MQFKYTRLKFRPFFFFFELTRATKMCSQACPEQFSSQIHIRGRTKGAKAAAVRDVQREMDQASLRVLKALVCGTVAAAAPAQEI